MTTAPVTTGRMPVPAGRKEEALWLLESVVPGSAANNLSLAFRAGGRLDRSALQRSLDLLLCRHEALRTTFRTDGSALLKSALDPAEAAVELEAGQLTAEEELTAFVARPFPLDGRLLVRAGLFSLGTDDVFCLAVHHLVFDTISGATLLGELTALYGALASGEQPDGQLAEPVPVLAEAEPSAESLAFWRERLAGFDPQSLAPRCGTPEVAEPTLTGERIMHTLSAEATAALRRLQRELRAPEAVVLLAAYYLLLESHGAGPDLIVGSPVDVRPARAAGAVGYHVNVLPLRVRVEPAATVRELVRTTREVFFDSLLHADVPVDHLSADLPRPGNSWRNLLFRHLFNYLPATGLADFTIGGLTARPLVVENGFSKFDLELFVLSSPQEVRIRAVYGTEFFARADVEAMLTRYDELLVRFDTAPDRPVGELQVWSERDHAVIDSANRTTVAGAPTAVLAAVRERAVHTPQAVAVVDGDREVTYRALWQAAVRNRRALAGAGAGPGDVVGLAARRGAELIGAVLGTWLTGAAYLPIDPEHPAARITFQLEDSGARVVLTDRGRAFAEAPGRTVLEPAPVEETATADDPGGEAPLDPDAPAYLIYTSGSTGTPKGTAVSHRSLANLIDHFTRQLGAGPQDSALWLTTFAFDISALELFLPLACGGHVVVAPDAARVDGKVLLDLLERHRVNIVQATPTTWRMVLDQVGDALKGRRVLCGGEPAPVPLAQRLLDTGCEAHHVYGPTETTIWSTSGPLRIEPGRPVDVGRPIANTRVAVIDLIGRRLPVGVRGELRIAGDGVALGYHGRPELTAERFGEDPQDGRYYRTGDEARWRADGTIELLGRADRQVKLRGNRIELGEVESAVLRHPRVSAAAVVVAGDPDGDAALVAYVVAAEAEGLAEELWRHCREELPRAWAPQEFLVLDALPTNASEKVDYPELTRRALAPRQTAGQPGGPGAARHDGELVAALVELWSSVLTREDADADTHFFANGGHSLLGALLVQRIEEETGLTVELADLFAEPTPAGLAQKIRR